MTKVRLGICERLREFDNMEAPERRLCGPSTGVPRGTPAALGLDLQALVHVGRHVAERMGLHDFELELEEPCGV